MPVSIHLPEDVLEAVASHYGLPTHVVDRIVRHQFKYVRQQISSGDMRAIRLHNFGVFAPIQMLKNESKSNRVHSDKGSV